jgi:hypothetical protein
MADYIIINSKKVFTYYSLKICQILRDLEEKDSKCPNMSCYGPHRVKQRDSDYIWHKIG